MRKYKTAAKTAAAFLVVTMVSGHITPAAAGSGSIKSNAQAAALANAESAQATWKKQMEANIAAFNARVTENSTKNEVGKKAARTVAGAASTAKASVSRYDTLIARHAAANKVPAALAHAVIHIESGYRANARGRAGEVGLMQIKPATARGLGYSGTSRGLYDPDTNLRYGMKYLAEAYRLGGGDICTTILKYNAGHGARRMNPHSSAYCSKVKRQMASTS